MEEKQKITVTIGGRKFTFHILPENEERVRDSVKKIEEKVAFYASKYATKDMQDILSIVLMEFVMQYISLEQKDDVKDFVEGMQTLDKRLDEYINSGR
ncbi:MAG: cell division protein ZapA [Bacteroidales bacterium]|nr:cell division protein ZapA [Bacteroidales bacterium]